MKTDQSKSFWPLPGRAPKGVGCTAAFFIRVLARSLPKCHLAPRPQRDVAWPFEKKRASTKCKQAGDSLNLGAKSVCMILDTVTRALRSEAAGPDKG
jgi:hypothetical protein